MTLLEYRDVWKRYTEASYVLRSVNLRVEEGRLVVISGPNGSGKTTLLKIGAGILRPSRGEALVKGVNSRLPSAKRWLGVVLHEPMVYPELSVYENLKYYAGLRGIEEPLAGGLAAEAFEELGLTRYRDRRVEELSFGWRRRTDIVRALLGGPPVILIDEPFTGLDPGAREGLASVFRKHLARGGSILATTPLGGADIEFMKSSGLEPQVYRISGGGLERVGSSPG